MLPAGVTPVGIRIYWKPSFKLLLVEINPELVQRFFENKCNPEEREAVLQYLEEHPDAMEKFFPLADWHNANTSLLPEHVSKEMLQQLRTCAIPRNC